MTGNGVSWKSDGAIWNRLTAKISSMNVRFDDIFTGSKEFFFDLADMNYFKFRSLRKAIRKLKKDEGLNAVVKTYIKGW